MQPEIPTRWSALPDANADPALRSHSRLENLRATGLLHGGADDVLDRLTRIAAKLLGVPTSVVSLVDDRGQSFAGLHGLGGWAGAARGTPLSHSFCQHVVIGQAPFLVADAHMDERVRSNGAVADLQVIAYAGVPLVTADGETLGALCAIDAEPRVWTAADVALLEDLAAAAVAQLDLRIALKELSSVHMDLQREHLELQSKASRRSHRDEYSGLMNAVGFEAAVRTAVAVPDAEPVAVLAITVDGGPVEQMAAAARLAEYPPALGVACLPTREFLVLVSTATTTPAQHRRCVAAGLLDDEHRGHHVPGAVRIGVARFTDSVYDSASQLCRAAVADRDRTEWMRGAGTSVTAVDAIAVREPTAYMLIADAFPDRLGWAAVLLRQQGWDVAVVSSASDALAYDEALRAKNATLSCVLISDGDDIADGTAIGALLRFDAPRLPVIRLGGRTASVGGHRHDIQLMLPCDPAELLTIVSEYAAPRAATVDAAA